MADLRKAIAAIGKQMVSCDCKCKGVARMPSRGILPRCLILEDDGRAAGTGVIVCGLNPGTGTKQGQKRQEEYYLDHGVSYDTEVKFWDEQQHGYPYYEKLRNLVIALKIPGPILWTDTVKCQKEDVTKAFSHSEFPATVRRCIANYLHRELEACPPEWIAIGVGRDAFATLSLVCPKRFVLGVPHCTGQYANKDFGGLFDSGRIRPQFMKQFRDARAKEPTGALWLTAR